MSGIGVGAFIDGERPKSKKALREALRDAPATVRFDATAAIGPDVGASFTGDKLPEGRRLDVTGPDPYRARDWWANVELVPGKGVRFDQKPLPAPKPSDGKPDAAGLKLSKLTHDNVAALRETLTAEELATVTLGKTYAVFGTDAAAARRMVEQAKQRATATGGARNHPAASLSAVLRKLDAVAAGN